MTTSWTRFASFEMATAGMMILAGVAGCSPSLPNDQAILEIARPHVLPQQSAYELLRAEIIGRSVNADTAVVRFRGHFRVPPSRFWAGIPGNHCDTYFENGVVPSQRHCERDEFDHEYALRLRHFDTGWQFDSVVR